MKATTEIRFGELARLAGGARSSDVLRSLERQEAEAEDGNRRRIAGIMVDDGILAPDEARRLLRLQRRADAIPGYILLERIGEGGMGVVFRGVQRSLARPVAVKIVDRGDLEESARERYRERFLREARNAARLRHPNLVQPIDFGETGGLLWFAMELVEGPSVGDRLDEGEVFAEEEAIGIAVQTARAIGHLWEHDIAHRDLKPHNVLLAPDGTAKLTDLGLSKDLVRDGTITADDSTLGTPHYISPELAMGEELDVRSDLYSLGATLYHMVTGEPPYQAPTKMAIMERHVDEDVEPPRRRNPDLSPGLDLVIRRMMARRKGRRYPTAAGCVEDLVRCQDGRMPGARTLSARVSRRRRPGSSARRLGARRRRRTSPWFWVLLGAALVAAAAVLLVGGAVG